MRFSSRATLCALLVIALPVLPGCVAKTAYNVATAPVKATAKAADWATVSREEADRNLGRDLRRKCKERYDAFYCRDAD
ncbi:hypothetical protein [Sphingobium lignivorans]|uniref:Lipoprotein n=1 Tax=Sphingobium lignivorans TaxID=2735886 RepID=A0ABR6NIZ9_9SPHN|nr:hypothetical protein [Sphingobium lignivorans]MBB5987268.1 hypothetical protein [Sphingobium lignivorans]